MSILFLLGDKQLYFIFAVTDTRILFFVLNGTKMVIGY